MADPQRPNGAAGGGAGAGAPFNFAPASSRDKTVYGSSMPGKENQHIGPAGPADVAAWAAFVRSHGVTDVVSLLGDDELTSLVVTPPGLEELYRAEGLTPHMIRVKSPGAHAKIMAVFAGCEAAGGRAVAHCSGGVGRVGTVLTAWLAHRYGLTYEAAAAEVEAHAAAAGVRRKVPSVERFEEFVSGSGW